MMYPAVNYSNSLLWKIPIYIYIYQVIFTIIHQNRPFSSMFNTRWGPPVISRCINPLLNLKFMQKNKRSPNYLRQLSYHQFSLYILLNPINSPCLLVKSWFLMVSPWLHPDPKRWIPPKQFFAAPRGRSAGRHLKRLLPGRIKSYL